MKKRKTPEGVNFKDKTEQAVFEVVRQLDDLPYSTLVRIGDAINRYEWPDELPGKPDGWDEMDFKQKRVWVGPIYGKIEVAVGEKALLRYFHTGELGKTDAEFEDWWDSLLLKAIRHHL